VAKTIDSTQCLSTGGWFKYQDDYIPAKRSPISAVVTIPAGLDVEQWRIQDLQTEGGKVKRRRRKYRGAESAEGLSLGRGYPLPMREGFGKGHCPLPQKIFRF